MNKKAIMNVGQTACKKVESLINNTEEIGYDPSMNSFSYKTKNGLELSLNLDHEMITGSLADVSLSYSWKNKKFAMSRSKS